MKGCQSPNLKKPDKQGVQQSFRSPAMQKRPRSMTTRRDKLLSHHRAMRRLHQTRQELPSPKQALILSLISLLISHLRCQHDPYIKRPISALQHLLFQHRKLLWVTADESSQFFTSKMSNRRDLKNPKTLTPVCQKRLSNAKSVDEHLPCAKM